MTRPFGSGPVALWLIKHIVSPVDRFVVKLSRGRFPPLSSRFVPTLLLTTVGRRSGQERTVPLIYVADATGYVVCNVRPPGERRNPWVINMRAAGGGLVDVGGRRILVDARELFGSEVDRWWPRLTEVWPAFAEQYAATGERALFSLQPAGTQVLSG